MIFDDFKNDFVCAYVSKFQAVFLIILIIFPIHVLFD